MIFMAVITSAKNGGRIYREGWGSSEYAFIVNGDAIKQSINELYGNPNQDGLDIDSFFLRKVDGRLQVYVPSVEDYMADDWKVAIKPSNFTK